MLRADIVNALADRAVIVIDSTVDIGSTPIVVPQNYVDISCSPYGSIVAGGDAFVFTGTTCKLHNMLISAAGKGATFSGLGHRIYDNTINASGDGITLVHGGGAWVERNHLNGAVGGNGAHAFVVNDWDTLWLNNNLTEEFSTGIRCGSNGSVGNVQLVSNFFDRAYSVGVHLEPGTGFTVHQMQIVNGWVSHATFPFIAEAQLGPVASIQISNLMAVSCANKGAVQHGAQVTLGIVEYFG